MALYRLGRWDKDITKINNRLKKDKKFQTTYIIYPRAYASVCFRLRKDAPTG